MATQLTIFKIIAKSEGGVHWGAERALDIYAAYYDTRDQMYADDNSLYVENIDTAAAEEIEKRMTAALTEYQRLGRLIHLIRKDNRWRWERE